MNLIQLVAKTCGSAKPRSRGDEPELKANNQLWQDKTPLTRG